MRNRRLLYVITCHHKHVQSGSENTFLIRLVDNRDKAEALMQSIYDDALANRVSKYGGKYSDPKWLDDKHLKVQVTHTIFIGGWLECTTIETYSLGDEWKFNIFSDKLWVLE